MFVCKPIANPHVANPVFGPDPMLDNRFCGTSHGLALALMHGTMFGTMFGARHQMLHMVFRPGTMFCNWFIAVCIGVVF